MMRALTVVAVIIALSALATDALRASHVGTDMIDFMASTRGNDYDGDGKREWRYSYWGPAGWHGGYGNALDEIAQTGSTTCSSSSNEGVDFVAYGYTDFWACDASNPCASLTAVGTDGVYGDLCDYVQVALSDYNTGNSKGMQRMVHANDAWEPSWQRTIATTTGGYWNYWMVGNVAWDPDCQGGWSGYHVHHDFQQPTQSATCQSYKNTGLDGTMRNWEKENANHWVHSVHHDFGHAC